MYSTRLGWSAPLIALWYTVHKNRTIFTVSFYCYYSCRNSHVGRHLLLFEKHDTTWPRLLPDNFYVRNLYRTLRNSAASPRRQHPPRRRFPADASDAHPRPTPLSLRPSRLSAARRSRNYPAQKHTWWSSGWPKADAGGKLESSPSVTFDDTLFRSRGSAPDKRGNLS